MSLAGDNQAGPVVGDHVPGVERQVGPAATFVTAAACASSGNTLIRNGRRDPVQQDCASVCSRPG